MSVPRNKIGFPQSLRTKLKYVTKKDFDVDGHAAIEYEAFRANGMFDPEVSVGGHQPRGFDQSMAMYNSFTVLSSKISVNWAYAGYDGPGSLDGTNVYLIKETQAAGSSAAASACPPVMCGIYKGTDALALPSTAAEVMEHDRTVWKSMNCQQPGIITSTSCRIGSFYGKSNLVGAEGYSGTASADPDEQVRYTVWVGRTGNTSAGKCFISAYVTITYDVVFTEPKVLQAS